MLSELNIGLADTLAEVGTDANSYDLIEGLAHLGRAAADLGATAEQIRKTIVEESAAPLARLVARDLAKDPRARQLVVRSYLQGEDPMKEFREVAAYDWIVALQRAEPAAFSTSYIPEDLAEELEEEEEEEEAALMGLAVEVDELDDEEDDEEAAGMSGWKRYTRSKALRRVGKHVAVATAAVGAAAVAAVTGAAAAMATAARTGFQMRRAMRRARAERKDVREAEAEVAATETVPVPQTGQIASTTQQTMNAAAGTMQGQPAQQGGAQAASQIVHDVVPQAMASYAAGQVAGKTPVQIKQEFGVAPGQVQAARLQEAPQVMAGATPSAAKPGWLLPAAAAAGGGLLIALLTGSV